MTPPTFVWAHDLLSCVDHENTVRMFDWTPAEQAARMIRYDARGHGRAMAQYVDRAYRWSALVDDMLRVPGRGPFVAGGIGMGAATALTAAVRAPRRLAALVLVAPPAGWQCRYDRADEYQRLAKEVEQRGAVALAEAWPVVGQPGFLANRFDGPAELLTRHLFGMDPNALPCILRGAALSDLASPEEVHEVIVPTLILAWGGDEGHPLCVAEELASLMIQGELHVAQDGDALARWPHLVGRFLAEVTY